MLFKFDTNGGTGGSGEGYKNTYLNRSHDPLDDSHRVSTGGNADFNRPLITK
jgi:hypothetical protein